MCFKDVSPATESQHLFCIDSKISANAGHPEPRVFCGRMDRGSGGRAFLSSNHVHASSDEHGYYIQLSGFKIHSDMFSAGMSDIMHY